MLINTQAVTITFVYDDTVGKWEVFAMNVSGEIEAVQAFNAVVLTCRQATPTLEANKAEHIVGEQYKISVGI